MYCVYITMYRGNKMPPFYIGSSSTKMIESGYNGSPGSAEYKSILKIERVINKNNFNTKILSVHETREEAYIAERRLHLKFSVHENPMFINKHVAFSNHYSRKYGRFTDQHRANMSIAAKKRGNSPSRKGTKLNYEQRLTHSLAQKRRFTDPTEREKLSTIRKFNFKTGKQIHHNTGKTLSIETRNKISESLKRRSKTKLFSTNSTIIM